MEYLRRKAKDLEKSLKEHFGAARSVSPIESPISETVFYLPGIADIHNQRIKNTLNGIRIIKKENEGIGEGAIVFLSAFYQTGMDIVAAVNSLGKIDPRVSSVSESEYGYDVMGGLTGKIIEELGMPVFLEAYVNSDPYFWQEVIEQKMGKEFYEEYKTKGFELVDQAKYRIKEPDF